MKERFTIIVFAENKLGLLQKVMSVFTRQRINIKSVLLTESEIKTIYRCTIVICERGENVQKLVKQIEKQIEVFAACYYSIDEVNSYESALYKLPVAVKFNDIIDRL